MHIQNVVQTRTNDTGYVSDFGIHKGIVIDVSDPIPGGGRIQVYVPDIHGINLFGFLNSQGQADIPTVGGNVGELNGQALEYLKTFCPWADICSPILSDMGPGSSGDEFNLVTPNNAQKFEGLTTQFGTPGDHLLPRGNPFAYITVPSYSQSPAGTFSVPRVGAQVMILFYKGDINYPVCIGGANGAPAFTQIFALDGSFQNAPSPAPPPTGTPEPEPTTDNTTNANSDLPLPTQGGTPGTPALLPALPSSTTSNKAPSTVTPPTPKPPAAKSNNNRTPTKTSNAPAESRTKTKDAAKDNKTGTGAKPSTTKGASAPATAKASTSTTKSGTQSTASVAKPPIPAAKQPTIDQRLDTLTRLTAVVERVTEINNSRANAATKRAMRLDLYEGELKYAKQIGDQEQVAYYQEVINTNKSNAKK